MKNLESISPDLFRSKQPRYLCLEVPATGHVSDFEDLITRAAPRLETLVLRAMISYSHSSPMSISGDLLGRCAPELKTLAIQGPFTHEALWTSPILHRLVNLSLTTQPTTTGARGPHNAILLCDILEALHNMQQLGTLIIGFPSLDRRFPRPSYFLQSSAYDGPRVHLPQLSTLRLLGNHTDITRLTNHLAISPSCTMRYRVDLHEERPAGWFDTLSTLVSPAAPLEQVEVVELLLFPSSRNNLQMRCWSRDTDEQPRLALQIRLVSLASQVQQQGPMPGPRSVVFIHALDAILANLGLSRLRQLRWACSWLDFPPPSTELSISDYAEVLRRFEMVESLRFDTLFGHRHELGAVFGRSILPRLKTICFVGQREKCDDLVWLSPPAHEANHNMQEEIQGLATVLLNVAQTHDLETLEFRGCRLSKDQADHFVGVAPHIIMT